MPSELESKSQGKSLGGKPKAKRPSPVSLAPLDGVTALKALLRVKPADDDPNAKKQGRGKKRP